MSNTQSEPSAKGNEAGKQEASIDSGLSALKDFPTELDHLQRFRLQVASDFFHKMADIIDAGTGIYEKLILLDGATIALSITFLGNLSTRLAAAKVTTRPHLWLVGVSWSLLIISIYASYRVIIDRHKVTIQHLGRVSSLHTEYLYQRLGILVSKIGGALKVSVPVGEDTIEFPKVMDALNQALKQEGETQVKKVADFIAESQKENKENIAARVAVTSTIAAIVLLSVFTMLSLRPALLNPIAKQRERLFVPAAGRRLKLDCRTEGSR